jgi:hypothetical protein
MTPAHTIAAVRRAIAVITEHGDAGTVAVAVALRDWVEAEDCGSTLDSMLRLPWGWRQALRLQARDDLLRDIAHRRFPAASGRSQARQIDDAVRAYETTGWRHDRAGDRPGGLAGDCFDVMKLGGSPGFSMLRRILGGQYVPLPSGHVSADSAIEGDTPRGAFEPATQIV